MATTRIKVPTFNADADEYETYVHEIDMWKIIGKVDQKEQAMMLVYELKKDDSSGIRDKIMNEISIEDLNKDDGMQTYITYMNKHFKKDESVATYEAYLNFERCKKKDEEEIKPFILRFDKQSNIAKKKKVTYPNLVLALKLLDNCMLSEVDRKLVLSEMDFSKDEVYDMTKSALMKYKSNDVCSKNTSSMKSEYEIKTEETVMVAKSLGGLEEALVASGWQKPRSFSNPERGRGRGRKFQDRRSYDNPGQQSVQGRKNYEYSGQRLGKNPFKNGEQMRCYSCDSIHHMKDQCPHRGPNNNRGSNTNNNYYNNNNNNNGKFDSALITLADKAAAATGQESAYCAVENIILYSGNNKSDLLTFCQESINCAILDSACTANVWFRMVGDIARI